MEVGLIALTASLAALALLLKAGAALIEDRWLRRSMAKPARLLSLAAWTGTYAWGAAGIALLPLATATGPIALVVLWCVAFVVGEIVPRSLPGEPPIEPPEHGPEPGSLGAARAGLAARWLGAKRVAAGIEHDQVVERLFRFRGLRARHVMVPLVDLSALDDVSTIGDAVARIRRERYSRIPIYRERTFAIVGVVHSIDLVGCSDLGAPVTTRMRPADYVPATKPADALLVTMRYEGLRMVVVVDEYGGAIGIVTIEDLLERIVGEIDDEYDSGTERVERIAPDRWRANARLSVVRANERFGWRLPLGPYETLGGLLSFALGRIPGTGEEVEIDGHRLRVVAAEPRFVTQVEVSAPLPAADDSGYTAGR